MKNIMNSKMWFWAFILLLIINISAISTMFYKINNIKRDMQLQEMPPPPLDHNPPMRFGKGLQEKVGYSQDQINELDKVRRQHMSNMMDLKDQLQSYQRDLFNEVAIETPDEDKIKTFKHQIAITHEKIIDESLSFYESVRENSTPEQLSKFNAYFRESKFMGGRQHMNRGEGRRFRNRNN